ncbi:MAG: peptidoglycan glycosyltransferase [Oscillospiraceae bacterium]|jgi:stage V sporulation protein D (sporulation-specific penicillin-binding protein)|nr:peptidoglycan glycosyltransferase [Oscillospiraceae bacterium]
MAKPVSSNSMKIKMNIVLAVMITLGFCGLIGRLYYLQLVDFEENRTRALRQQLRPTTIAAQRGAIYDRNMKTLAASATVWAVIISPAEIKSDEELNKIADFLAPLLEIDREKIMQRGQKKSSYYEIIKQRVEKEEADKITAFSLDNKLSCIHLIENSKRYYPYGSLASTLLGFTTNDNTGAYGLESKYEKILSGTPGMIVSAKNAKSGNMPSSYERQYEPVDGNSLVLTIDEVVQHSLERHLETAVIEHNVHNRATGIVMDVNTGAILAMATKPDFDPNQPNEIYDARARAAVENFASDPALIEKLSTITDSAERAKVLEEARKEALGKAQFQQWRNKAISDPYEPGSVFKVITSAIALDLNVVKPTGQYFTCPGYHIVAGRRKACWKSVGHGTINFTEAVKFSCNPAFMMVGASIGPQNFYDYFDRFGLRETTRIDLPGEADGIFYDFATLAKESGEELASSSFGQTFKVTPIQIVTAVSAAVNGGKLMQPYVVSQVLDPEGNVISTTEPVVKRQVISEETSKVLDGILEHVVGDSDGSGRYAYVPGYRVGGKTGTSEKLDAKEDGEVTKRISSFLGVAPSNDPQICVLVLLDEPHMQNIYGSIIAAPIVGAVMTDVLPYLGVEPQYNEKEIAELEVEVPALSGQKIHDAIAMLTAKSLKYKTVGEGVTVTRQLPAAGEVCPKGSTVILYTDKETQSGSIAVPNVLGLSAQQANRTLLNAGLNIRLAGDDIENAQSVAISQEPAPETMVDEGAVVTVTFAVPG